MRRLVLATRKSALALAQARAFAARLVGVHPGLEIRELLVVTTGDRIQDRPLNQLGGKALFVKEIEEALLSGDADLAVHSLKDVPAALAPGLALACVPAREDPRDAVVSRGGRRLAELAPGGRVGTSSLRRRVQLASRYPHLAFLPLRGNVDTRLRRCEEGVVDAVVLAFAGLRRLGLAARAAEVLSPAECLPAAGQGALGIETRAGDESTRALLAPLDDARVAIAVAAERGVLEALQGNCTLPVAAHAEHRDGALVLRACFAPDESTPLRRAEERWPWPASAEEAAELGRRLAGRLG